MEVEGTPAPLSQIGVQTLAIGVFKDEQANEGILKQLDELTGGIVSTVIEAGELKGKEGETTYLHLQNRKDGEFKRFLLIGVGERADYRAAEVSQLAGTAVRFFGSRNIKSFAIVPRAEGDPENIASTVVQGAIMGQFELDKYRTIDKEQKDIERLVVVIEGAEQAALQRGVERGQLIGEAVNLTRDLANEPGGYLTPTKMADRAREMANRFGLEIDVLDEARMEQEGMGSLLSVARGSDEPAQLIILKYTPKGGIRSNTEGLLALVGKGITFDSGGISLKPGENMELMKYDMTGGATVLGVMQALAQLQLPMPVLGVVPCAENLPSGKATKPGDVVRAMTGKTIEVINTDAEGRLILADAIAYAKKLGATKVIDLATLTGAVSIALGDVNVAILGTDQELIDSVISSGKEVGEKFWQLPLDKEYTKQIKSDIADIKNVGGRKAGTITAAAFLKEFADDLSWAHLDIAGTAWGDEAKPYRSKGPTGIAVRTLINLVMREAGGAS